MNKQTPFFFLGILAVVVLLQVLSCKSKSPYNPYLTMKQKPSEVQAKESKKVIKKNNRTYKKVLENSRKHLFGRKHAAH